MQHHIRRYVSRLALRDPLTTSLADPPAGTIAIGFWRHLTSSSLDPEFDALHRQRATVVHDLVEQTGLHVKDWGGVDAPRSSEVVEVIVGAFSSAVAADVVAYLRERIRERRKRKGEEAEEPAPLKAVTMRRPDGAEIVWEFRQGVTPEQADEAITRFVEGKSMKRILGS